MIFILAGTCGVEIFQPKPVWRKKYSVGVKDYPDLCTMLNARRIILKNFIGNDEHKMIAICVYA